MSLRASLRKCSTVLRNSTSLFPELSRALDLAEELCEGALRGGDVDALGGTIDKWVGWLKDAYIELDESDYAKAAIYALYLAPRLAATDYGTTRQRDLAQLWTDALRGLLGEVAFIKWLNARFGVKAEPDYSRGSLKECLPSDIKRVDRREPRLKISIKTTKLSGIWLDVPYKQVEHSDVFILVRVGITREHFLAFLKAISVIRDKILAKAKELEVLPEEEIERLWNEIPNFRRIPAIIVGFIMKSVELQNCHRKGKLDTTCVLDAEGRIKKGGKGLHVTRYIGFWEEGKKEIMNNLIRVLNSKGLTGLNPSMEVEFEGIGSFTKVLHFIASSGYVVKTFDQWKELVRIL